MSLTDPNKSDIWKPLRKVRVGVVTANDRRLAVGEYIWGRNRNAHVFDPHTCKLFTKETGEFARTKSLPWAFDVNARWVVARRTQPRKKRQPMTMDSIVENIEKLGVQPVWTLELLYLRRGQQYWINYDRTYGTNYVNTPVRSWRVTIPGIYICNPDSRSPATGVGGTPGSALKQVWRQMRRQTGKRRGKLTWWIEKGEEPSGFVYRWHDHYRMPHDDKPGGWVEEWGVYSRKTDCVP